MGVCWPQGLDRPVMASRFAGVEGASAEYFRQDSNSRFTRSGHDTIAHSTGWSEHSANRSSVRPKAVCRPLSEEGAPL